MSTAVRNAVKSVILILLSGIAACQVGAPDPRPGLIGLYFSEPNLTAVKAKMVLTTLEQDWNASAFQTTGSSGIWIGNIVGPADGEVTFYLSTNKILELQIGENDKIDADMQEPGSSFKVAMVEGKAYPVRITFYNDGEKDGKDFGNFSIKWSWDDARPSKIPAASLHHTARQDAEYDFLEEADPESIDQSQFLRIDVENHVVYYEEGRFGGWPANGGIWNWGDEILVGFNRAYYKHNPFHHSIDASKPGGSVLGRSLDGGATWGVEEPENFNKGNGSTIDLSHGLSFSDSDLAIRNDKENFVVSNDRGKTWSGPYDFANLGMGKLQSTSE